MKQQVLLTGLLLVIFLPGVFAQQETYDLIPYRKGSVWGYCDSTKRVLIKPLFENVAFFYVFEGRAGLPEKRIAIVKKNGKYGLINDKGKLLTSCRYERAFVNSKKTIRLIRKEKVYDYQTDKETVVFDNYTQAYLTEPTIEEAKIYPTTFNFIKLSPGKCRMVRKKPVYSKGAYTYVSDSTEFEADTLQQFQQYTDSVFLLTRNDRKGLVTFGGRQLLPVVYDSLVAVYPDQKLGKMAAAGFRDRKWQIAHLFRNNPNEDSLSIPVAGDLRFIRYSNKLFLKQEKGWGLMYSNGNMIVTPLYDSIFAVRYDDAFAVQQKGSWHILCLNCRDGNRNQYQDVKLRESNILARRQDGLWVLLDGSYREMFPHKELFEKYANMYWANLIVVYKDRQDTQLIGYASPNGLCYWD